MERIQPQLRIGPDHPQHVLVPDGTVSIYNQASTVDVIADLIGYYATGTGAGFTGAPPPAYWTPGSPTASPQQ